MGTCNCWLMGSYSTHDITPEVAPPREIVSGADLERFREEHILRNSHAIRNSETYKPVDIRVLLCGIKKFYTRSDGIKTFLKTVYLAEDKKPTCAWCVEEMDTNIPDPVSSVVL